MLSQASSPRIQKAIDCAYSEMRAAISAAAEPHKQKHAALLCAISVLRADISKIIASIDPNHSILQISDDADFFAQVTVSPSLYIRRLVGVRVRAVLNEFFELDKKVQPLKKALDGLA